MPPVKAFDMLLVQRSQNDIRPTDSKSLFELQALANDSTPIGSLANIILHHFAATASLRLTCRFCLITTTASAAVLPAKFSPGEACPNKLWEKENSQLERACTYIKTLLHGALPLRSDAVIFCPFPLSGFCFLPARHLIPRNSRVLPPTAVVLL